MEDDDWKPSYFTVKKWSMALICLADIVIMAVYAVMGTYLANRYIHDFEDIKPHEAEYTKVYVLVIIELISILSIIFSLIGLFGIIKEYISLTYVYLILSVVNLIACFANSIHRPYFWVSAAWAFIVIPPLVYYLYDLNQIEKWKKQCKTPQSIAERQML